MKSQMRNHSIKRGDGRTVTFKGRKAFQVGKAGMYETVAGNMVFQYAPHGNRIGLIVEPLPSKPADIEALMAQHCSGHELDGMLRHLGQSTIHIE